MTDQEWGKEFTQKVVKAIVHRRKELDLSVAKLSERTKLSGYPISTSVLTNLENGRRGTRLDLVELLVLAAALEVPPGLLMFPGYPDRPVEYLPGEKSSSRSAVRWFSGNLQHDPEFGIIDQSNSLVRYAKSRDHHRDEINRLKRMLAAEEFTDDQEQKYFQDSLERQEKLLRIAERELKRHSGTSDHGTR